MKITLISIKKLMKKKKNYASRFSTIHTYDNRITSLTHPA